MSAIARSWVCLHAFFWWLTFTWSASKRIRISFLETNWLYLGTIHWADIDISPENPAGAILESQILDYQMLLCVRERLWDNHVLPPLPNKINAAYRETICLRHPNDISFNYFWLNFCSEVAASQQYIICTARSLDFLDFPTFWKTKDVWLSDGWQWWQLEKVLLLQGIACFVCIWMYKCTPSFIDRSQAKDSCSFQPKWPENLSHVFGGAL